MYLKNWFLFSIYMNITFNSQKIAKLAIFYLSTLK